MMISRRAIACFAIAFICGCSLGRYVGPVEVVPTTTEPSESVPTSAPAPAEPITREQQLDTALARFAPADAMLYIAVKPEYWSLVLTEIRSVTYEANLSGWCSLRKPRSLSILLKIRDEKIAFTGIEDSSGLIRMTAK